MKMLVEHLRLLKLRGERAPVPASCAPEDEHCRYHECIRSAAEAPVGCRRCGGAHRVCAQTARAQRAAGHTTVAVHRSDTARRAMPPWADADACIDVVCGLGERLNDVFPVGELDVVVVGIFHQARAARGSLPCVLKGRVG